MPQFSAKKKKKINKIFINHFLALCCRSLDCDLVRKFGLICWMILMHSGYINSIHRGREVDTRHNLNLTETESRNRRNRTRTDVTVCCLCPCRCLICVSAIGRCSSRRPRLRRRQRLRRPQWQGTFRVRGVSGASLLPSVSPDMQNTLYMGFMCTISQRFGLKFI